MSNNQKPYERLTYFALALDPIHVGTGGYRLGRVDLSIVREPGTGVPKVPGTSLTGACRTYAAMALNRFRWKDGRKTFVCAGQGQPNKQKQIEGHCCQYDCPICVTFGFAGIVKSFQGLAQFTDARLVLFPVHSLVGPVWVTCPDALRDWGVSEEEPAEETVRPADGIQAQDKLNLGWLMLDVEQDQAFSLDGELDAIPDEIRSRAVLVSNKLFPHVVNDNLEVRTSVSIDPATGAAAEGALFTYEALPRASVLAFEVTVSHPQYYNINGRIPINGEIEDAIDAVTKGLSFFEALGIGGMNTRGMGRLRILNLQGSVKQPKGGQS